MDETLYIKVDKNNQISSDIVTIGDICKMWCTNSNIIEKIKKIKLMKIPNRKRARYAISVMRIIELIDKAYPGIQINNIGESDFIIDYIEEKNNSRFNILKVAVISLITFLGSAYAIMAYNNDVNTDQIIERTYEMFLQDGQSGGHVLEIAFSVGLTLGIIVFYNHFGGKKITNDPTPLQVEMDQYETQIDDALINRSSKSGAEKTC